MPPSEIAKLNLPTVSFTENVFISDKLPTSTYNSPQSQTLSLAPPDRITADNAWSGLETERTCELTISGSSAGSVDIAKVRLLVMLDELVGPQLHVVS